MKLKPFFAQLDVFSVLQFGLPRLIRFKHRLVVGSPPPPSIANDPRRSYWSVFKKSSLYVTMLLTLASSS